MLIAVGGLVACGKSSVARGIAQRGGWTHIEADRLRDQILHIESGQIAHEAAWPDNLRPGVTEKIYAELIARARGVLLDGGKAVLDGCFARREQRAAARTLADKHSTPFLFVESQAPRATLEQRLRERSRAAGVAPEAWIVLLDRLANSWEPATELDDRELLRIDTSKSTASAVDAVLARVRELRMP